jgi:ATP-binding cassette subfamily A (ABC1) protein 1
MQKNITSMEECEALCTKLAIMSRGQFQCFGSVQHLKSKYGNGYGLILKCKRRHDTNDEENDVTRRVEEFMSYYVPESLLKDKQQNTLFYQIALNASSVAQTKTTTNIAQLFSLIEKNKHLLDLETYSLTQTSLEQVFLSLATSSNNNNNNNTTHSKSNSNRAYKKDIDEIITEEIHLG